MRQQRAKRYRKAMALYQTTFKFREPYQVLLSSDFVLAAHRFKLNLASLLERTIQGQLKLMITQCCIAELYKTGDQDVIALAKKCERRRCGHVPDPVSGHDCITACLNIDGDNKHRYILATQDETLRAEMRTIPGVPMMYIRRAVMIMEPPSPASLAKRDTREREKLGSVEKRKRVEDDGEDGDAEPTWKKRKAPKEPNPKSVMKKKKKPDPMERRKEERREDGEAVASDNIIGEISDSVRRSKSVRRRKSHKKASKGMEDSIPALPNAEGQQS